MRHIVQFSGGKDSTAMLLRMVEENMPIDEILFCDTGLEFPQMYQHIEQVENYIGRKITRVKSQITWEYDLLYRPIQVQSAINKRIERGISTKGYGFPIVKSRWCTRDLKLKVKKNHLAKYTEGYTSYIGIASDEAHRVGNNKKDNINEVMRYPLVDWGMSENDCLAYCKERGFYWGGLYDLFKRVSCWCCPLQANQSLANLYKNFPALWLNLKEWDKECERLNLTRFRLYGIDETERRLKKQGLI